MTFSKKATILSLTTIVALALAACSNGNSQTQPSQTSQVSKVVKVPLPDEIVKVN